MKAAFTEKTLIKLEFNKITEKLSSLTLTSMGKNLAEDLYPSVDIDEILHLQKETTEARELLRIETEIPLNKTKDIWHLLLKLDKGAVLEPDEILSVAKVLSNSRRLKKFILDRKEKYPILSNISVNLLANKTLEDEINEAVLENGEISDNASPELRSIRRQIKSLQESIKDKIDNILRSSQTQKYLQDNIVTIRGDRYVVPVRQEYRNQFPGIIHDQSASGATIYVEPMAIVEKNNELRQVKAREKQEIIKILTILSAKIREEVENLKNSMQALGQMDLILAKARLSQNLDCGEPLINEDGQIDLKRARHPLITGNVVPIDINMGKNFDILVITGPNTGGKTVTLKTVGLLAIMAQSGLHIPAETGSKVCILNNIFADIGDEQSIEQSLSTFSSHMKNIIEILKDVDNRSLVLFDELGAGTDPTEGAALAMSILDYLHSSKAKVIATTHYSELKTFAFKRERIENASVEFNPLTLKPSYRLNIGQPGHSSAFDIARGLGLGLSIIDKAKSYLSTEELYVADLVHDLETNKLLAEQDYEEASRLKKDLEIERNKYNQLLGEIETKKIQILEKARVQASNLTRKASNEAEEILSEIKEAKASVDLRIAQNAKNKLKDLQREFQEQIFQKKPIGKIPSHIKIGDQIYVPKLDSNGTILTRPDNNGELQVMVGIMKINLKVKELRTLEKNVKEIKQNNYTRIMSAKIKDIKNELDLRGLTVEEAFEKVDKYLDDASLAGLPSVCLIHGKGTGALRSAINEFLKKNNHVRSYRAGQYGEGGIGVTIVEL